MEYTISQDEEKMTLEIKGDILGDVDVLEKIKPDIESWIEKGVTLCSIDLSKVNFMNSTGLTLLLFILTKFRNKGGDVELVHVPEKVEKLLIATKLASIFHYK